MVDHLGISPEARQIHEEAIVIDGMNNSRLTPQYFDMLRAAGLTAVMVPVSVSTSFREGINRLCQIWSLVEKNADKALIVTHADDVLRAKKEGKVGLILALEDTVQIEGDAELLQVWFALGVRRMQLVYITQNLVGCGKGDRPGHDSGLSAFGATVVRRMEDTGLLIDLCHCADTTLREAWDIIHKPTVFSHTNVRGAYDHPNNMTDEQLAWAKSSRSVVGISGEAGGLSAPEERSLDALLAHVGYVKEKIGADHVGIGLSYFEGQDELKAQIRSRLPADRYNPARPPVRGLESYASYPRITEGLLRRGYSKQEIHKVLGGNFLRVFKEVWPVQNRKARRD